eukprot:254240-Chlamydomonas_euryale.AAC.2
MPITYTQQARSTQRGIPRKPAYDSRDDSQSCSVALGSFSQSSGATAVQQCAPTPAAGPQSARPHNPHLQLDLRAHAVSSLFV